MMMAELGTKEHPIEGDYFYNPDDWEYTHDAAEEVCKDSPEIIEIQTLIKGPVIFGFNFTQLTDGARLFDNLDEAKAAFKAEQSALQAAT